MKQGLRKVLRNGTAVALVLTALAGCTAKNTNDADPVISGTTELTEVTENSKRLGDVTESTTENTEESVPADTDPEPTESSRIALSGNIAFHTSEPRT